MEQTPEGLAAAAATREAIKRKRQEETQPEQDAPEPKKTSRPPPTCSHEVMLPEGFDASTIDLDPQIFGAWAQAATHNAALTRHKLDLPAVLCALHQLPAAARTQHINRHGSVSQAQLLQPALPHQLCIPPTPTQPESYHVAVTGTLDKPEFHGTSAKQYPFTLDPFQQISVSCLVKTAAAQGPGAWQQLAAATASDG
jgi:hypothetical protein